MAEKINLQPQLLDLMLYAGDGASFKLICTDKAGASVNMSGEIKSQIRKSRALTDSAIIDFTSDMTDANQGIIILSLTGVQTQELTEFGKNGKFYGVWDVEWTPPNSSPRTVCQGKVECVSDVTR